MIVWQGHGYRIEQHVRAFGDRMPLPFALDRLELRGRYKAPCLVNVGWYATLDEAHRARNIDVEMRSKP